MTTESAIAPKYRRGQNPASRANLKPPWQPGEAPNPHGVKGPRVRPALENFADMTVADFKKLDLQRLTVGQMVALAALQKAAFDSEWGDKMRAFVADRLDGPVSQTEVQVNVGVQVNLGWSDGRPA